MEMSSQFHAPAALPPVPNVYEAGPVWTLWIREKKNLLSLLGIKPKTRKTSGLVTTLTELSWL
jgi:hypothetical protein